MSVLLNLSTTKVHDELDFLALQRLYGPIALEEKLEGEIITSPYHLYSVETLRTNHRLRVTDGIPTDVFVFAKGESPKRHVTKVGGLPYWPADQPWPSTSDGLPMRFMAQICFLDSKDLLPELPGDVLLILTEDEESWAYDDLASMHFFWQRVQGEALVSVETFPSFEHEFVHCDCYGVIHRSADYPDAQKAARSLKVRQNYNLALLSGTKIGGVPDHLHRSNSTQRSVFLGQLGSIQPAPFVAYPWVNREQPYDIGSGENSIYSNQQTIGDMGSLYLFLNENGSVECSSECY